MSFLAYRKAVAVGRCLDGALAALAVVCAQSLHGAGRASPPALESLHREILACYPPVTGELRRVGDDCQALMDAFTRGAHDGAPAAVA
jgi:hypothetical protein